MTTAEVQTAFGSPRRIQRHADGSEDWYYRFGTQTHESEPFSTTEVNETEKTYSVGQTTSTTTTMNEFPIRFSPGGRVTGQIPKGSVVVE